VNQSTTLGELAAALSKAQGELPVIVKTEEGTIKGEGKRGSYEYKYQYADLASVVRTTAPILTKHGLSVSQHPSVTADGMPSLVTFLLHSSGEFISSEMVLLLTKTDAQGQGSAITYARRYAYCAVLGLVTDDDDGEKTKGSSAPIRHVATKPDLAEAKHGLKEILDLLGDQKPACVDYIKECYGEAPGMTLDQTNRAQQIAAGWPATGPKLASTSSMGDPF
jgi:hypothetical protein